MVSMFLDDEYGCGGNFNNALKLYQEIKGDLLLSGFVSNVYLNSSCSFRVFRCCIRLSKWYHTNTRKKVK